MPGRSIRRRLAAWTATLATLGAVALVMAIPAAADPPPWVGALQPGQYIAFTVSNTSPPVFARSPSTLWGPVTLTRQSNLTFPNNVVASEPGSGGPGWPSTFSASGITLQRADQFCAITQNSCQYYFTSGAGRFFFAASGGGAGAPDLGQFSQGSVNLVPAPPPTAVFTVPAGGALPSAGSFTFDGSGSSGGLPGALDYQWTLTPQSGSGITQDGPQSSFTPPASIFNQDGQYCVTLVVRASDGAHATQGPSCFAVTVAKPTPTPPQSPPQAPAAGPPQAPAPGPPAAAPVAAGPAPAAPLSFAKPLPNFAVPVPGAVQQVTVIWLWKPDWFQPIPSAIGKAAKTAGRPKPVKRASVSVTQSAHHSSPSAAPWLTGLGAFGIFGAGWVAYRRRSLRSSLLD